MAEDRDHALSLAYMREHPAPAARVLEELPAAEAAALFARVPARLGAAVLASMLPRRAAGCLARLEDARALELLAAMPTQPTVALLRHVPEPRRRALIGGLPAGAALASSLLLGFTEDTLGAWADPDVVVLPGESRAAEALERMRRTPAAHPFVFVADAQRRLAGVVGAAALLQAPSGATLAMLAQRPAAELAAHAALESAPAHPGWEAASALPVVEPGGQLVGVMTRDALARAVRRLAPASAAPTEARLPALLAAGYWQLLAGLLEGGLAWLPRVPALDGQADER